MSEFLIWLATKMMGAIIEELTSVCIRYVIKNRQVIWKYTTKPFNDGVKWSKTAFEDIANQASQISQQGWKRHDQAVETLFSSCQWRFN